MMKTSEHIFRQFQDGNLEPFYRMEYPDLLLYASSILRGSDAVLMAEDCVQDAVEKTYYQCHSFTTPSQWKMYLLACIRNGAISMLRSCAASRNYGMSLDDDDVAHDYMLDYIREETLSRLMNAIDSLPPELSEVFRLSFDTGLKISEIAARLGIAEITVKKRKARMIALLRRLLGADYLLLIPFL